MVEFFLQLGTALKWGGIAALPLFLLPLAILIVPGAVAKPGQFISAAIDRLNSGVMRIAFSAAILMVLAQLAVIIGRFVFGWSRTWMSEIVIFSFAAMFLFGAAATLRDDAHVRVDILHSRLSPRTKAIIELIGIYCLLVPMCLCIIWASTQGSFVRAWTKFLGSSEDDGLPIWYIFKTFVPAFAALLAAQGLSEAIKTSLGLKGLRELEHPHPVEPGPA